MEVGPKLAKKTGRLTNLFCDKGDFWRISDPFGLTPLRRSLPEVELLQHYR